MKANDFHAFIKIVNDLNLAEDFTRCYNALNEAQRAFRHRENVTVLLSGKVKVGAKVSFPGRRNRTVNGKVTAINRSTATVKDDLTGQMWRVALSLLGRS